MRLLIVCEMKVQPPGQNSGGTEQALACLAAELRLLEHEVNFVACADLEGQPGSLYRRFSAFADSLGHLNAVHIATQGPLGLMGRRYCCARGMPFTASHHTQIPEYLRARGGPPLFLSYAYFRWFYGAAAKVIVPTPSMARQLNQRGITNTVVSLHGVDTQTFHPGDEKDKDFFHLPRPVWLTVARLTVDKSLDEFFRLDLPGSKVAVGDGPLRKEFQDRYPDVYFAGHRTGMDLVKHYQGANFFVFPSRTDTFGLVLLEALACGLPVAAFPITGPIDVITDTSVGCLDKDLRKACQHIMSLEPSACRRYAEANSWSHSAQRFLAYQEEVFAPEKRHPRALWLESFNWPMMALEPIVDRVNHLLF